MSKVIITFETPNGCFHCPCMSVSDYDCECHCAITRESVEEYAEGKVGSKPKWCPLMSPIYIKPLGLKGEKSDRYAEGWNDCLNKIIGDNDETN